MREQALAKHARPLEAELQAKLHGALTNDTAGYAKITAGDVVFIRCPTGRQLKIGPVEHVEGARVELQVEALRQSEQLRQAHVRLENPRADKGVSTEVPNAAQARRRKHRQIGLRGSTRALAGGPAARPSASAEASETGKGAIRPLIPTARQQVIAAKVDAVAGIHICRGTANRVVRNLPQFRVRGTEGLPVRAALHLPDSIQRPAAREDSADTLQVLAR